MIGSSSGEYSSFGSGNLLEDVFSFVFEGNKCKLVLIGDSAQLPPVGCSESPALDVQNLEYYGANVIECFLSDVVRQEVESGILSNANAIRFSLSENSFFDELPTINQTGFKDVIRNNFV